LLLRGGRGAKFFDFRNGADHRDFGILGQSAFLRHALFKDPTVPEFCDGRPL
jgi:hypothetical protein